MSASGSCGIAKLVDVKAEDDGGERVNVDSDDVSPINVSVLLRFRRVLGSCWPLSPLRVARPC